MKTESRKKEPYPAGYGGCFWPWRWGRLST